MTPKNLSYILTGIISILIALALTGFWLGHQQLDEKAEELSHRLTDTSLVNEQIRGLQNLQEQYEEVRPLEEQVYQVLPAEKQQSRVSLQLNQIVDGAGLNLRGLTFESTSGQPGERSQTLSSNIPGVLVMPVRFTISSEYQDFLRLLESIENQQRYMQVSNLSINRGDGLLQFSVNLEVFLRP